MKHGVDRAREFSFVCLVDVTGVNPKVLQAILACLFSTEPDLLISRFVLASAICYVLKCNFLIIFSPGVRKYSVRRNWIVANQVFSEAD